MASGSFYGSIVNEQQAYLFWSYTQDVSTRKTTLTLTLKVKRVDSGAYTYKNPAPYEIECPNNTTLKSGTINYDITDASVGGYLTIASSSKVLDHGTDGIYGSISMEGIIDLTGTSVGTLTTGVHTLAIPDIPVASTVQSTLGSTIGGNITITLDSALSSFTHTLKYTFGTLTGTITTGLTGSTSPSYVWNTSALRDAFLQEMPSSASKTLTITVETYSGSTLLGTKTYNVTLYPPSDAVPSISSIAVIDPLEILGAALNTWFVQSKSKIKVKFNCAGYLGSTIVTRELKINGSVVTNTLVGGLYEGVTALPISFSSGNTYQITVTDSRGKSATTGVVSITQAVAYSAPYFASLTIERCDQYGALSNDGTYLLVTPNWEWSPVVASGSSRNTIVTKRYKIDSGSFINITTADNVSFVIANGTPAPPDGKFSVNSSYTITVELIDTLGTITDEVVPVASAKRIFSINAAGTGVAIGKAAEVGATNFDVALESRFRGHIDVTDDADVRLENGSALRGYTYGSALKHMLGFSTAANSLLLNYECEDNLMLYAKDTGQIGFYIMDSTDSIRYKKMYLTEDALISNVKVESAVGFLPPIGFVLTTSNNTNPGTTLGGTWVLVDKHLKDASSSSVATATSACTMYESVYLVNNTLTFTGYLTTAAELTDTQVKLCGINYSSLGISGALPSARCTAWADGNNGIGMFQMYWNSTDSIHQIDCYDVIQRGSSTASLPSGTSLYYTFVQAVPLANRLDAYCDLWYWKRTA